MKTLIAFSAGVVIGAAAVLSGVCAAALVWSSGQPSAERSGRLVVNAAKEPSDEARTTAEERRIDEELAQTFPASDPLPYSHQVN